ncbi:MAG: response regulator [Minisyncoccales bacterium]
MAKKLIMIVDDQEDVRLSIKEGLKTFSNSYNFIIMDVLLPGENGIEIASELKRIPDFSKVPIVFISASNDQDIKDKVGDYGVLFMTKPFEIETLNSYIAQILKK